MKVSELAGAKLDFYVAKALGLEPRWWANVGWVPATEFQILSLGSKWVQVKKYSTDGNAALAIIEQELRSLESANNKDVNVGWVAVVGKTLNCYRALGSTYLEAIMRAFVGFKFGEEVPEL